MNEPTRAPLSLYSLWLLFLIVPIYLVSSGLSALSAFPLPPSELPKVLLVSQTLFLLLVLPFWEIDEDRLRREVLTVLPLLSLPPAGIVRETSGEALTAGILGQVFIAVLGAAVLGLFRWSRSNGVRIEPGYFLFLALVSAVIPFASLHLSEGGAVAEWIPVLLSPLWAALSGARMPGCIAFLSLVALVFWWRGGAVPKPR